MPFRRLLVPLDGSRLAECVLPLVRRSAKLFHCAVTLLHVLEKRAPTSIHGDSHLRFLGEAERYLEAIAEQLRLEGLEVDSHVHEVPQGDVPRCIVSHARELDQDLVVLCTHGMGGMRRLVFGSNAEQVLTHGATPVLLVQPNQEGKACAFGPDRILVLLDEPAAARAALEIGAAVARRAHARLYLLAVVPTLVSMRPEQAASGRLAPRTTSRLLDLAAEEAVSTLQKEVDRLIGEEISVSGRVERGAVETVLPNFAQELNADLVVLAAQRMASLSAFRADAVITRITAAYPCTFLLMPSPKAYQE